MTLAVAGERPSALQVALAYLELTKPRIVLLVLFTGVPALLMAANGFPGAPRFFGTLAGIALAAASAACFNHWYDRDLDALMKRTARRPLPAGKIAPTHALAFGFALAAAAWVTLMAFGNLLAAVIGMLSIVYYAVIYTIWLKRRTPQNIVIGGGAGASAPLIAWVAVTGHLSVAAVLLAAIDYARAGIPMLPVTHGEPETRRQILIYTLVLVPVTLALAPLGVAGPLYWVPAAALGAYFIVGAVRLLRTPSTPLAMHLFRYSILYLFALYLLLTVDAAARLATHARL